MIATPLEQFEIIALIPFKLGFLNLSFTNSSLFMLFVFGSMALLLAFGSYQSTLVPNRWQYLAELSYSFVFNMIDEQLGKSGHRYFPLIFVVFMFVFFSNVIGMIPYSFTVTSHIIVTFGLALALFVGINIIGLREHGLHFFSLFLPKGAPIFLAPLLVMIELISYIFRVFSLSIRLFANMMAGHTLLKILAGFGWTMLMMGGVFYILHLLPLLIVFLLTGLEIGIAFLQAYVFTILTCMYLNDAIHLH
uniref:ATP synthase subunit a n=1 Tax=Ancoracysta twista TaxID=2044563 RepID=A0A2H4R8C7_9EUKA|nr:ATP synthase F0 subunit a [Ancoracysta twista]YP_009446440.1 ATP synthase F0 subunit a [Ancoracysta twista]ATY40905.1 ATP synthase F0 subunit a [Ancoracysta twista]ATY40928.1 ATP synthase F0 subunit a [Ancoracysta twista]